MTAPATCPSRLWIGGWYHNYNFVGDIDEVRISKVARSADWIRLQYENQKQEFFKAVWSLWDWDDVDARFAAARRVDLRVPESAPRRR